MMAPLVQSLVVHLLLVVCLAAGASVVPLSLNTNAVDMGREVTVTLDVSGVPLSPAGTVFWPFVNGSQWGSFVTCRISAFAADDSCSLMLPLPYAGTASLQLAVFPQGRKFVVPRECRRSSFLFIFLFLFFPFFFAIHSWCQEPDVCMFPVGTALDAGTATILTETALVTVRPRVMAYPVDPGNKTVCMDWFAPWRGAREKEEEGGSGRLIRSFFSSSSISYREPWFTRDNLGLIQMFFRTS
jgi:hypothetical protein